MRQTIETPRVNPNEDDVIVIDLFVTPGQKLERGDLIAVVESTKAANEIHSEISGVVEVVHVEIGQAIRVGETIIEIEDGQSNSKKADIPQDGDSPTAPQISAKALKKAKELGIDIETVEPVDGRIRVADVAALAVKKEIPVHAASEFPKTAIVIGAGGHASYVIEALEGLGCQVIGCVDKEKPAGEEILAEINVIGGDDRLPDILKEGVGHAFIGLGGATDNGPRKRLFKKIHSAGFIIPPLVHPSAKIAPGTVLGAGAQVLSGAVIGPRSTVGVNTVINQGVIVCHDVSIGNHAHLTPGAILAGRVTIGNGTTIGMGSTVLNDLSIGADCLIHNNTSVVGNVSDGMEVSSAGRRWIRKLK